MTGATTPSRSDNRETPPARPWRAAVGAAAGSELSPADPGLLARLLGPCLRTGPFSQMLTGNEPRELIRELYRMRRRARALAGAEEAPAREIQPNPVAGAPKEFRAWYRTRHPGAPKGIAATAESIIEVWDPGVRLTSVRSTPVLRSGSPWPPT